MEQKKKILIVDDEPNILLSLEFLMKKNGFEVYIARDGEEALNIIQNEIPQMVILDIMMPKVDGYEVCQHIRGHEQLQHIKVIFLTAKTKESDIQKGLEMGADMYVTKPFSTKDLISKVHGLLA